MVTALVISDTHNNQILLSKVLSQESQSDYIFHLGDYYDDISGNLELLMGKSLIRVPGIYNSGYISESIPLMTVVEIEGWKIGCVHAPHDIRKLPDDLDLIMHGHTHTPKISNSEMGVIMNPGHLKGFYDRGNKASYALLSIIYSEINIEIKDYECNRIEQYTLKRKTSY